VLVLEHRAQHGDPSVDLGLDRALGPAEGSGDVRVGQAVDVAEDQGCSVRGRQRHQAGCPALALGMTLGNLSRGAR
jgi:hypothetical protein